MNDIVERLKRIVVLDEVGSTNPLARDAADTIEALRKQVEELSVDLTIAYMAGHGKGVEALRKQVEELTQVAEAKEPFVLDLVRQRDAAKSFAIMYSEEAAKAQAREQKLREALKWLESALSSHIKVYGFSQNAHAILDTCKRTLALPQDDSSLRQYGAKLLRDAAASFMADKRNLFSLRLNRMADELEGKK